MRSKDRLRGCTRHQSRLTYIQGSLSMRKWTYLRLAAWSSPCYSSDHLSTLIWVLSTQMRATSSLLMLPWAQVCVIYWLRHWRRIQDKGLAVWSCGPNSIIYSNKASVHHSNLSVCQKGWQTETCALMKCWAIRIATNSTRQEVIRPSLVKTWCKVLKTIEWQTLIEWRGGVVTQSLGQDK